MRPPRAASSVALEPGDADDAALGGRIPVAGEPGLDPPGGAGAAQAGDVARVGRHQRRVVLQAAGDVDPEEAGVGVRVRNDGRGRIHVGRLEPGVAWAAGVGAHALAHRHAEAVAQGGRQLLYGRRVREVAGLVDAKPVVAVALVARGVLVALEVAHLEPAAPGQDPGVL